MSPHRSLFDIDRMRAVEVCAGWNTDGISGPKVHICSRSEAMSSSSANTCGAKINRAAEVSERTVFVSIRTIEKLNGLAANRNLIFGVIAPVDDDGRGKTLSGTS
ncbi:hypothetical protein PIIN_08794 [Serendipita indica DSM 11827]|uniref:Uncharacterized protein n=1 Tax=Serendipita indica (strain DSM 11827) TaxID=1109443 RepID=G4TU32_SERID|nr:hypothetical protein PIIN_08794 [Serendipita indica DSM 11827]